MRCDTTLLDLVTAVSQHSRNEREVIAVVVHLVNSGRVRLCGNFAGARFAVDELLDGAAAEAA